MKKVFLLVPLMLMLMVIGVMGALDVTWSCPISTSSATTTVRNNAFYEAEPPFAKCNSAGNNFTIEFVVTGTPADWGGELNNLTLDATLYIIQGSTTKFTLPIATAVTNVSATDSSMIRFTDFGELHAAGGDLPGYPKWYGNLTDGGYKWYVYLDNMTDIGAGPTSRGQVLTSEMGVNSNNLVSFSIESPKSPGVIYAQAQAGIPEAQAVVGAQGVSGGKDGSKSNIVIILIICAGAYFLLKKQ